MRNAWLGRMGRYIGFAAFPYALLTLSGAVVLDRQWRIAGLFFCLFLLTVSALPHWKRMLHILAATVPIWLLVATAFISVVWSIQPETTIWRVAVLAGTTAYGVYFHLYHQCEEQISIIWLSMTAGLALSLGAVMVLPSMGIMSGIHEGAWQGIFWHKNAFGRAAALGFIALLASFVGDRPHKGLRLSGVALCLLCALGSRSVSSIAYLGAVAAAYLIVMSLRKIPKGPSRVRRAGLWVLALLGCLLLFSFFGETALSFLGRDTTLTGRTMLWALILERCLERPWLGYGYDAVFHGMSDVARDLTLRLGSDPVYAHNGFLDLFLSLGVLGGALFLACLIGYGVRAVAGLLEATDMRRIWAVFFLLFFLLSSMVESLLLKADSPLWLLFVTGYCNLFCRTGEDCLSRK